MAVCALGCIALAQPVSAQSDQASSAESTAEQKAPMGALVVGTSVVVGLGLGAGFLYWRRRRRAEMLEQMRAGFGAAHAGPSERGRRKEPLEAGLSSGSESTLLGPDPTAEMHARAPVEPAPQGSGGAGRRCPECARLFGPTLAVCPYDSTPLQPGENLAPDSPVDAEASLERTYCSGCDRRYPVDVSFCYHDGMALTRDDRQKAASAPVFKACERCGWEGRSDQEVCPRDGADLIDVDPAHQHPLEPAVPLAKCPTCRRFAELGRARCPEHGEVVTPVVDLKREVFPERGFGPRRKVCKHCGAQYGGFARFCSRDGSKLLALN